jgi:hypothetical protein
VSEIGYQFTIKRISLFFQRAGQQTRQWNTVNGEFSRGISVVSMVENLSFKVWKNSAILSEKEVKASYGIL